MEIKIGTDEFSIGLTDAGGRIVVPWFSVSFSEGTYVSMCGWGNVGSFGIGPGISLADLELLQVFQKVWCHRDWCRI